MTTFADVPEQAEAKRLLEAALADGPAHAYLFHGPAGVGKRPAAQAFAGVLLGDPRRVDARTHPDLRVIEALGEMIRIDEIRALHHDLHMRPFEADRRVYLILDAHRMNDEAAAALLKDLEEPPAYATIVLVADELGPLPETIRSRCQLVPFRRLSRAAVERWIADRAPGLGPDDLAVLGRLAGGRLDRAARQLDDEARARRDALLDAARGAYRDEAFDPAAAAVVILDGGRAFGAEARRREQELVDGLDLPAREAEQRVRRAEFGAEKAEVARVARRPRRLVSRPRRRRERRRGRRRPRRPARRAPRRRRRRSGRRSRGRGGDRPPGVARDRGVQPQPAPLPRGALRPAAPRVLLTPVKLPRFEGWGRAAPRRGRK